MPHGMMIAADAPYCPYCGLRIYVGACGCCEWHTDGDQLVADTEPPECLVAIHDTWPQAEPVTFEGILKRLFYALPMNRYRIGPIGRPIALQPIDKYAKP